MTTNHLSINKQNKNFEIWHFIAMLLPLILVTIAVVAVILHTWASKEANVIDLVPTDQTTGESTDSKVLGEISREILVIREDDSDTDSAATAGEETAGGKAEDGSDGAVQEGSDDSGKSSGTGSNSAKNDSNTTEANPSWKTITSVDLFKTTYTNDAGEVTVKSSNGDDVVAPGTSNDYDFSLKNTGNVTLNYTLDLKQSFTLSNNNIPFQVRLRRGSTWLVGSAKKWASPEALDKITEKGTLGVNRYVTYTLEWRWPFDEDDKTDTGLGNKAMSQNINFKLDIITKATANTVGGTAGSTSGSTSGVNESAAADNVKADESAEADSITAKAINATKSYIISNFLPQEETGKIAFPVNIVLLALALFALLLLVHRREKVQFTGYLKEADGSAAEGQRIKLRLSGRNILETKTADYGWFEFLHIPLGRRILILEDEKGNAIASKVIKLQRSLRIKGVEIDERGRSAVVKTGENVAAIEIYLYRQEGTPYMYIDEDNWAAMDKHDRPCRPKEEIKNVG